MASGLQLSLRSSFTLSSLPHRLSSACGAPRRREETYYNTVAMMGSVLIVGVLTDIWLIHVEASVFGGQVGGAPGPNVCEAGALGVSADSRC